MIIIKKPLSMHFKGSFEHLPSHLYRKTRIEINLITTKVLTYDYISI